MCFSFNIEPILNCRAGVICSSGAKKGVRETWCLFNIFHLLNFRRGVVICIWGTNRGHEERVFLHNGGGERKQRVTICIHMRRAAAAAALGGPGDRVLINSTTTMYSTNRPLTLLLQLPWQDQSCRVFFLHPAELIN